MITAEYINRRRQNIENHYSVTSQDFKDFAKEFKSFINRQLKRVGGTKYEQLKGTHYYISGFFTLGEKIYFISLPDVRIEPNDPLLIREAENYKDFHGKTNRFIDIKEGMFDILKTDVANHWG